MLPPLLLKPLLVSMDSMQAGSICLILQPPEGSKRWVHQALHFAAQRQHEQAEVSIRLNRLAARYSQRRTRAQRRLQRRAQLC